LERVSRCTRAQIASSIDNIASAKARPVWNVQGAESSGIPTMKADKQEVNKDVNVLWRATN
jgi:hypothetical protein